MHFPYGLAVLAVAFAGCANNGSPASAHLAPPGPAARSTLVVLNSRSAAVRATDRGASRMNPAIVKKKLLYVSDPGTGDVQVYAYPQGTPAGTLTGFTQPQGICTDRSGNVYVANTRASNIVEFAFGGTSPIATLSDPGQYPVACAVDPNTGNLAVSNTFDTGFNNGSVSIYAAASGTPTVYPAPSLWQAFFLSYDAQGDIFVDGLSNDGYYRFLYTELPAGASTFSTVTINTTINYPGGVSWTGAVMAVGDQEYAPTQSAIYQVTSSGSGGTVVGTTVLKGTCDIVQFAIETTNVVAADACKSRANVYRYPAGGPHTKVISAGLKAPVGSAISHQPPR